MVILGKILGHGEGGMVPPDISKPVNIFDPTPYKQQVWEREHPGEEYPGSEHVYADGETRSDGESRSDSEMREGDDDDR